MTITASEGIKNRALENIGMPPEKKTVLAVYEWIDNTGLTKRDITTAQWLGGEWVAVTPHYELELIKGRVITWYEIPKEVSDVVKFGIR